MTVEADAALQRTLGEAVIRMGNCCRCQGLPMFYRPLLPFQQIAVPHPTRPWPSRLGGVQYVAPDGMRSNSEMRFILAESAEKVPFGQPGQRSQTTGAIRVQAFRNLNSDGRWRVHQKSAPGLPRIYERTGYAYKSERRDKAQFAAWARVIFGSRQNTGPWCLRWIPNSREASISQRVEDTVLFATLFATSEALKAAGVEPLAA